MKRACWRTLMICGALVVPMLSCLQLTGGGTDTETGGVRISGHLVDASGTPLAGAEVRLIPALYNPVAGPSDAILIDTVDRDGAYAFRVKAPGVYNVQAKTVSGERRSLISGVHIEKEDQVLPSDTLRRTGAIMIEFPSFSNSDANYVYVPGTTYYARVHDSSVVIDSLPSGTIPAVYYIDLSAGSKVRVITVAPVVIAGDTTIITSFQTWKYSQKLILNTSPTGADVAGDVVRFPVCVRLSPAYFAFDEALPDGADIRFTNASGAPIPHEIEYWNAEEGMATVWVLLDTVHGGSSDQFITMYWGNPGASSLSAGTAVFDTANGFAAVWHLSDPVGSLRDATANRFHGVSGTADLTSPAPSEGLMGRGMLFNGTSSGFFIPNSGTGKLDYSFNGRFTLSAWAFFSRLDTAYHPIVCKGDDQYGLQIKDSTRWEIFVYQKDIYFCARERAVAGFWKHVVGVRDSNKIALYIDGALASDSIIELPWPPKDTTRSVFVGAYPSRKRYWNGFLDEVRIQNEVLSADWIKLCYMNQRREDKLVVFAGRQ